MSTINGETLRGQIFNNPEANFGETALKIFGFQYNNNPVYRSYCNLLKKHPGNVNGIKDIPFLPIGFFKTKKIITGDAEPELFFESSGTTGSTNSKHFVTDRTVYEESFLTGFRNSYGDEKGCCIIGLLPSYLERQHSSLVYMVQELIKNSLHANSGFYLDDHEKLRNVLLQNEAAGQQTILIGVTYALIDFAEKFPMKLEHTVIMETGGMKGRREELTRNEVHGILSNAFSAENIHSEYGMTELLSQAYSKGKGIFITPSWMRVLLRSEDDPFEIKGKEDVKGSFVSGAVNIIDLANIYSCSFIAADDAGKLFANGDFEIIGRLDSSDIRGCSLMLLQ